MTSRLDRLFLLLDTGSSPVTRKAAALQLGDVQKLHPHELHNLLAKVRSYLLSNSWDTRIAAGQAVEAIVKNVPQWDPTGIPIKTEEGESSAAINWKGHMTFSKFDINKVIQHGGHLLASEGKEYELDETTGVNSKEKVALERQLLNKRLGLDIAERMGLDTNDIFSNDDLQIIAKAEKNGDAKKELSEVFETELSQVTPNLGDKDISKISKRRSRLLAKQKSKESPDYVSQSFDKDSEPQVKKPRKTTTVLVEQPSTEDTLLLDSVPDNESLWEESKEWPLESFCDEIMQDLFSPSWEERHGAAIALREIVKIHGKGAGKTVDTPSNQMELVNQLWLEDLALRLLCVLALDKFGDFISDQVVAPVRETCAQALGSVLNLMWQSRVEGVLHIVLQLMGHEEWEARHGGLLVLKYLLAIRQDMTLRLLPVVFHPVFKGLQDPVDDVSAVAAAVFVPVTHQFVEALPEKIPEVIASLWDSLLELDDLTASTSSILMLLSALLSHPSRESSLELPLADFVPRLWPFLGHSSSIVRKSALQTLVTLTTKCKQELCEKWLPLVLSDALRLLYQRCLVENIEEILQLSYEAWKQIVTRAPLGSLLTAACPFLSGWLCMVMQPAQLAINPAVITTWLEIKSKIKEKSHGKGRKPSSSEAHIKDGPEQYYLGGVESLSESPLERDKSVMRARHIAARFLGLLSCFITKPMPGMVYTPEMESPIECFAKLLLFHLNSKSAFQRMAVGLVLLGWAEFEKDNSCPLSVKEKCFCCLCENIYFDEIALAFTRVQQECKDFMAMLRHYKLPLDTTFQAGVVLTLDQATALSTTVFSTLIQTTKLKPKVLETLDERRRSVLRSVTQTSHDQLVLNNIVQSSLASALVALHYLPDKLNPIIRPLMESIKKEENEQQQYLAAKSLIKLLNLCTERSPCPNPKVIKNITTFLCTDSITTSNVTTHQALMQESKGIEEGNGSRVSTPVDVGDQYTGILLLHKMQKLAEKMTLRRSNSINNKRAICATSTNIDTVSDDTFQIDDETHQSQIQKRGATFAITEAARYFGAELPQKLPKLWEITFHTLKNSIEVSNFDPISLLKNDGQAQDLVNSFQVLEVIGSALHPQLHSELVSLLPYVSCCLKYPYSSVRHMSARTLGMLSKVITDETMKLVLGDILERLERIDDDIQRQGAIEALACVIDQLGLNIVPYIVLLIVPVLGKMTDHSESVRLMATHCFASLIRLMPLEGELKDNSKLCPELNRRKAQERQFLDQLFDPKKIENYKVSIPIKAELRSYQQEGVNWLAFLNKYKLHGILCDDMGLGKTLQSLCIVGDDHYNRDQQYKEKKSPDSKPLPSLVVCPPTLTGHWAYEVEKFVHPHYLNPLHYTGPPVERTRLRSKAKRHNLIIASYDIVRNDIDFFGSIKWNYCILDEGHIIKNGKTKLAKAIKQLTANHRLILTGTPIQNNVLELWSLFDFLMPGFLGTEKQFTARYSKPILQSRDAKSSSKEQEAGVLAMESLHRQVLPFLLRRMKEDVLKDLPPKIIQDYYCDLSLLQVQLYEDFARTRAKQNLDDTLNDEETLSAQGTTHIFQALQYLRKVCNHPKLVLGTQHPEYERFINQLKKQNSALTDIQHAAKLCALRQLLLDCGIGNTPLTTSAGQSGPEPVVNQHRALVFCQLKSMLDIVERDLFKVHMPNVSYLRLDGTIPAGQRHSVVHQFNNDPSIDVLLLTTQVGGLGLNLTGADTVIFVEHDWNPMKDLQAMDRAHRIGQKKVVNVYRLITRGTLEEKIMGLQKFKMTIANTVISQDNSSVQTMGTDQLLELFTLDDCKKGENAAAKPSTAAQDRKGMKAVLENLPELWDADQYEQEYDLSSFLKELKK